MGMMLQRLTVDTTYKTRNRLEFLEPLLTGKKVLHVGFVDWPKTRPSKNLHLLIAPWCARLDGIDLRPPKHAEHLAVPNGNNYFDWSDVPNDYDVILVPEVIEHVDSVRDFFEILNTRNGMLVVTAPDAYLLQHHFNVAKYKETDSESEWVELVHPDHNCWYSPYTLKCTINKFSTKKVQSLHWLGNQSICAICQ